MYNILHFNYTDTHSLCTTVHILLLHDFPQRIRISIGRCLAISCVLPLACFVGGGGATFALLVDDDLVVHAKLALGHATQVALHDHTARHMRTQNLT